MTTPTPAERLQNIALDLNDVIDPLRDAENEIAKAAFAAERIEKAQAGAYTISPSEMRRLRDQRDTAITIALRLLTEDAYPLGITDCRDAIASIRDTYNPTA